MTRFTQDSVVQQEQSKVESKSKPQISKMLSREVEIYFPILLQPVFVTKVVIITTKKKKGIKNLSELRMIWVVI